MKTSFLAIFATLTIIFSCQSGRNLTAIQPKGGKLTIPAKGELRVWNNLQHASFEVELTNANADQSCEVYYVKSSGTEKWVNPSLIANSKLTVSIPTDGHLFLKNFNPNPLTISYQISE